MPISASVFRRGGPKKELFDVINEDVDESKELDEKLAELTELLHLEKSGKELSAALWRPHLCAAELVKQRKHTARDIGFIRGRRIYLHIEEAVWLLRREERPEQIWGYGAWAGCYSRQPHAPGSARMPPMQHQLPPADAPPSSHAPAVGRCPPSAPPHPTCCGPPRPQPMTQQQQQALLPGAQRGKRLGQQLRSGLPGPPLGIRIPN
eukprot:XP_001693333.1 predicted protein [Chlamydomonas reinhardtii]